MIGQRGRLAIGCAIAALLVAGSASGARTPVHVSFDHPDQFTDAGLHGGQAARSRAETLRAVTDILQTLGDRYLQPGQVLKIDVRDIDLAGRYEPWRPIGADVRVMRPVDWPRIKLRYTLEQNGQVARSAEAVVSDRDYLERPNLQRSDESLPYERVMLDDWFRKTFAANGPPAE